MEGNKKQNKLYRDLRTHHNSVSVDLNNPPYKQKNKVSRAPEHTPEDLMKPGSLSLSVIEGSLNTAPGDRR